MRGLNKSSIPRLSVIGSTYLLQERGEGVVTTGMF